ncbi:MAG: tetratricopeptide repeat protein, partial [Cyclobacteriaceae bacterium]|nr:tetratricopeptide repeat protein [Cyclobacteriaceae bacterium]
MHKTLWLVAPAMLLASLSAAQEVSSDSTSASHLLHRAEVFRHEGKVQETLQAYFAALRKAESDNDTVNTIHTARRLGEYYERYSRPHEAIPYYRRAYDLSK